MLLSFSKNYEKDKNEWLAEQSTIVGISSFSVKTKNSDLTTDDALEEDIDQVKRTFGKDADLSNKAVKAYLINVIAQRRGSKQGGPVDPMSGQLFLVHSVYNIKCTGTILLNNSRSKEATSIVGIVRR
eukprot:GHVL01024877.1.p1 GENE.GHVL01024877.1~~GHVL01024877.1.p1  ORF type:complete len:128 (-),score=16.44 GHVL01024877.1:84-467(-)